MMLSLFQRFKHSKQIINFNIILNASNTDAINITSAENLSAEPEFLCEQLFTRWWHDAALTGLAARCCWLVMLSCQCSCHINQHQLRHQTNKFINWKTSSCLKGMSFICSSPTGLGVFIEADGSHHLRENVTNLRLCCTQDQFYVTYVLCKFALSTWQL